MYRELVLPAYKKETDFVKSKTNAKLFSHCCGTVLKAAPLLIDAGIDLLNSLQPGAKGMETTYLKDTYGDKLVFHGGVDLQNVLPHGTPEDVEEEVKKRIAIWAPGGGYVCNAAHNIQPDVPPENVIAMYKAARKWGKYPLAKELLELREAIQKVPDFLRKAA
jgi:uroporphyrinogen decarboxylase